MEKNKTKPHISNNNEKLKKNIFFLAKQPTTTIIIMERNKKKHIKEHLNVNYLESHWKLKGNSGNILQATDYRKQKETETG